ncbi:MAG: hypothetical protein VST72_05915 [Nitrospirota bacterium]|nr:hypothetical protein [Nitrospirota bacterium]
MGLIFWQASGMTMAGKVDGAPGLFDELTDHHSQGFSFHIRDAHISRQSASSSSKSTGKVF